MKTFEFCVANLVAEQVQGIKNQADGIIPVEIDKNTKFADIKFLPKSVVLLKTNNEGTPTSYLNFGFINNTKPVQTMLKVLENAIVAEFNHKVLNKLFDDDFGKKGYKKLDNYIANYLRTKVIFVTDQKGKISWAFCSANVLFSKTLLGVGNHDALLDSYTNFVAHNGDYQDFKNLCYKVAKGVQKQIALYSIISDEVKNLELFGGYIEQLANAKKEAQREAAKAKEAQTDREKDYAALLSDKDKKLVTKLAKKATKVA